MSTRVPPLALLPVLVLGERVQLGYAAMLVGAIALNVWLLVSRWSYRNLRWRTVRIALGNILLVTIVARMTSPFLFAPAIATLATFAVGFAVPGLEPSTRAAPATAAATRDQRDGHEDATDDE